MGAVTVYTSADASAPTLTGEVGSLINVLSKILVEGYGSKAAAGWTKPFAGTNKAVFKMADGTPSMYLRVDDTNAQDARVVGYVTMSDVDTGTSPFPTAAQYAGGLYCRKSSTASTTVRPWYCIANEKAFYFFAGTGQTALGAWSTGDNYLCFGKFASYKSGDAYNVFITACTSSSGTNIAHRFQPSTGSVSLAGTGIYVAGSALQAEGSTQVNAISLSASSLPISGPESSDQYNFAHPDPVTGGINLAQAIVGEKISTNIAMRGMFPGLWHLPTPAFGNHLDTFSGAGELAGKTFVLMKAYNSQHVQTGRIALETSGDWGI